MTPERWRVGCRPNSHVYHLGIDSGSGLMAGVCERFSTNRPARSRSHYSVCCRGLFSIFRSCCFDYYGPFFVILNLLLSTMFVLSPVHPKMLHPAMQHIPRTVWWIHTDTLDIRFLRSGSLGDTGSFVTKAESCSCEISPWVSLVISTPAQSFSQDRPSISTLLLVRGEARSN